jgi:hypothetical protein
MLRRCGILHAAYALPVCVVWPVGLTVGQRYVYGWDRMGRKGQVCALRIIARRMGSVMVEFEDGHAAVTSWRALKTLPQHYAAPVRLDFGEY